MTETKIDEQVKASEFLPKGYTGDIRKDRCKGGGGVMIATKQEYDIQGIELEANISAKTVWATISLKDQRKLVVGSYYRPPDSGSDSIDDLESVLSFITEKFRNNPQCTIILGGDFNAGDIDWESHTVCEHSLNRQINKKILSVISSSGLVQIQKDFTRNDRILDLLCSGVVGRERMGTAFPHKKLSGNGVPTREILRDIFLLAIFHYRHVMTFSAHETISKLDIRICKVLAH